MDIEKSRELVRMDAVALSDKIIKHWKNYKEDMRKEIIEYLKEKCQEIDEGWKPMPVDVRGLIEINLRRILEYIEDGYLKRAKKLIRSFAKVFGIDLGG